MHSLFKDFPIISWLNLTVWDSKYYLKVLPHFNKENVFGKLKYRVDSYPNGKEVEECGRCILHLLNNIDDNCNESSRFT